MDISDEQAVVMIQALSKYVKSSKTEAEALALWQGYSESEKQDVVDAYTTLIERPTSLPQ